MNEQRIAVITDSGTDTPPAFIKEHDVRVVPLRINYADGRSLESGVDITPAELVAGLEREIPKTSLPSPERVRDAFEAARRDGYTSAVFVSISSGLSATCETVRLVANQLSDFPTVVVDTRNIGAAAGMVVMEAVRRIEAGVAFNMLGDVLDAVARRTRVFFSVKSLEYLHRGGRIGDAVYRIGSVLNVKPVLTCSAEGRYVIAKKARGWERALAQQIDLAAAEAAKWNEVRAVVCCHDDPALMSRVEGMLRDAVGNIKEIIHSGISADLLVHTGPEIVGVAVQGI